MVTGGTGNTLSLLHPNEMVLPANISTGLQRMIAGGNGSGSGITINASMGGVNTLNARSLVQSVVNDPTFMRAFVNQINRYMPMNPSLSIS